MHACMYVCMYVRMYVCMKVMSSSLLKYFAVIGFKMKLV